jgi:predicted nucleic acid-binding protein
LTAAEKGNFEIVVSGLCLVEVCKHPKIKGASGDAIAAYFEHDYILLVPVDKTVGTHARNLMMAGHAGLKPQDAVHIATALVANVDELHTFDDRMLSLDGRLTKLDGTPLKICKPSFGGPGTPLFGPSSKPYIPPSIPDDRPSDSENLK